MELKKKDQVLIGVTAGLLLIVVLVYAVLYATREKPTPIAPEQYTGVGGGTLQPGGKPPAARTPPASEEPK